MNRRDIALMDDGDVAQLLDAELDPSVSDTPFVVASDGGGRE